MKDYKVPYYVLSNNMFQNIHHNPSTKVLGTIHTELILKFGVGFVIIYNYKGKLLQVDIVHDNNDVNIII